MVFSASSVLYSVTTVIQKDTFVSGPFWAWYKMQKTMSIAVWYHQLSVKTAVGFIHSVESAERYVISLVDKARIENINWFRNREILKFIIDAIHFCAKQCITLRGDNEISALMQILGILKLMSKHNDTKEALRNPTDEKCTIHIVTDTK